MQEKGKTIRIPDKPSYVLGKAVGPLGVYTV